ncbi:MAG: hypothetical protein ABGY96_15460 [bacterium]|nr:hypothetical protein [Gammaproteobacteria bacterium]HIL96984.1 hypothetical protein [Pseudomonadales bacterium]
MTSPREIRVLIALVATTIVMACTDPQDNTEIAEDVRPSIVAVCNLKSLRKLPDVKIMSTVTEVDPVKHCKIAGVIGTETNFELLLPVAA